MHKPLLALLTALLATAARADTLVDNANGIQVDVRGAFEHFNAILIGDNGKVVRLFRSGDARPIGVTRIDVSGRTLLPGLIDAHGHLIDSPGGGGGLGLVLLQLNLIGVKSLTALRESLTAYASANTGSGWILGRGWNQELWPDKRFPTAADLDAVVSNRPVWLTRVDGHAAVGNTAAIRASGVTSATADPTGGKIERDAYGNPTGLFIDNAIALVRSRIPPVSPEMMDRALEAAQEALLATGITATADMGTSIRGWDTMRRLGNDGRLKIRIMSYSDGLGPMLKIAPNGPTPWLYADRLRMAGVKLYADGALGSRGARLKRPYADKPDSRGLQFMTDEEFRSEANEAAKRGMQVAVHAIGDAANAQVISTYEWLGQTYTGDRRWRIEHAQIVDPIDLPRIGANKIIASMQPTHQTSDRLMAEARLGPNRLDGAYAWASMLRTGARLAFGSDYPVESPNPFPGLAAAISRQDMDAQPPGGWRPEEKMTLAQALDAFTRGAAFAGFAEGKFGSLAPGQWADFILIDRDPTAVDALALARTKVLETWVAGRKVSPPSAGPGERGK